MNYPFTPSTLILTTSQLHISSSMLWQIIHSSLANGQEMDLVWVNTDRCKQIQPWMAVNLAHFGQPINLPSSDPSESRSAQFHLTMLRPTLVAKIGWSFLWLPCWQNRQAFRCRKSAKSCLEILCRAVFRPICGSLLLVEKTFSKSSFYASF